LPERKIERIQVVSIPALPPVITLAPPSPPNSTLPPVLVTTADDVAYYIEACDAFSDVDDDDSGAVARLQQDYPGLSRSSACDWAVYGFTVQGWLNFEAYMSELAGYVEQLRAHIDYQNRMMEERQKIVAERDKALIDMQSSRETSSIE
jgi:hypothetical protein